MVTLVLISGGLKVKGPTKCQLVSASKTPFTLVMATAPPFTEAATTNRVGPVAVLRVPN
jgi:hypothetical protein